MRVVLDPREVEEVLVRFATHNRGLHMNKAEFDADGNAILSFDAERNGHAPTFFERLRGRRQARAATPTTGEADGSTR